ncbi:MAG: 5-amino-6-(D-ribitylamino)uracil--L-tyrosine 4-hydroxyphenyl transferase CofH [Hyphomicrobiales bacterium]
MTVRTSHPAIRAAEQGDGLSSGQALSLASFDHLETLIAVAGALTRSVHGGRITFSKKVFIPLTRLCRDVCHYCTFAHAPRRGEAAYLTEAQVLRIAEAGASAGCKEALFTLGDKPELRYRAAREALAALGHDSTLSYLEASAKAVLERTGLLPHLNAGVMDGRWMARLRGVSASQGLMLESASERLMRKGAAHHGSPDKLPAARLATIEAAGEAEVPFTSGILIGIGETRAERIEALLALRQSHLRHGHLQEVIVQNFRAKPGTRMAASPEPPLDDLLWTIAMARLVFGPEMNIQAPPNLSPAHLGKIARAGINDWGGVSPVTPDHVNPEAPWPHLQELARATDAAGFDLAERLCVYPEYVREAGRWVAPSVMPGLLRLGDGEGLARETGWTAGRADPVPAAQRLGRPVLRKDAGTAAALGRVLAGHVAEADTERLFRARGREFHAVVEAADRLRHERKGDVVTYVVNRNINYTNVCTYGCRFCAFSKGRLSAGLRDRPYDLSFDEISTRVREARERGATEVCLQGGIAARYTGETYLEILRAVRAGAPDIHIHAFSPLEIWHGASTLGLPLRDYLLRLKDAGLSTLPGTAAEILDDEVRAVLCPDKITTAQWLEVMETAHHAGLRSTATIMFGHVDGYEHWARHLLAVRRLQERTGGFTEFVPLPFVHMEAPIGLKGAARPGPTWREAILMHAVARLVLDPVIDNIQASWVKMGPDGVAACLAAGASDAGGTLMNESITRAAGAAHGQEMTAPALEALIRSAARMPRQRTTLYGAPAAHFEAEAGGPDIPPVRIRLVAAE